MDRRITITYGELKTGMLVHMNDYLLCAQDVRRVGDRIRFEGFLVDRDDPRFLTSDNGETYGKNPLEACVIEVPLLKADSTLFFIEVEDDNGRWLPTGAYRFSKRGAIVAANEMYSETKQQHRVVDSFGEKVEYADIVKLHHDPAAQPNPWGDVLVRLNNQRNSLALTVAALRRNQTRLLDLVEAMRAKYGKLHDGLSDMLGDGEGEPRLFADDIPDDYEWLVSTLAELAGTEADSVSVLKEFGRDPK